MGFAYYSPRHWIDHERGKKLAALSVGSDVEMVGVDAGEQGLVQGLGQGQGELQGQGLALRKRQPRPHQRRYHHDVESLFQQVRRCCLQSSIPNPYLAIILPHSYPNLHPYTTSDPYSHPYPTSHPYPNPNPNPHPNPHPYPTGATSAALCHGMPAQHLDGAVPPVSRPGARANRRLAAARAKGCCC